MAFTTEIHESTSSPGSPMGPGGSSSSTTDEGADEFGKRTLEPAGEGWLLEEQSESRLTRYIRALRDEQAEERAGPRARWKAARWRRQGLTGVVVTRPDRDRSEWKVWAPPGGAKLPPAFNKAARLCRRLKSNLFADPPVPEAVPGRGTDTDDALHAAEFATRLLIDLNGPGQLNRLKTARRAFDLACTYDSGFEYFWLDRRGGGHRPMRRMASTGAVTLEEALDAEGEIVMRYVGPEDENGVRVFVEQESEADREWLPGLRVEVLTGQHVFPVPKTAVDIDECDGLLIGRFVTLGQLRAIEGVEETLEAMPYDKLRRMVQHRPDDWREILPPGVRDLRNYEPKVDGPKTRGDDTMDGDPADIPDDVHVYVLELFMRGNTSGYPWGARVLVGGDDFLLHRQEWVGEVEGRREALMIPVAQYKQFEEGSESFYGVGAMTLLGEGNEVRARLVGSMMEHLDRFSRRKVYYTPNSLFQPRSAAAQMGTHIPVAAGTAPVTEQVPEYPRSGVEMLALSGSELDDEIGLPPVAQGEMDSSVKSGLHAARLLEQVNVGLSDVKQSTEDAIVRGWRIELQMVWAFFDREQTLGWRGEDQQYKAKDWIGADVQDTRDVRISRGSFTMLSPTAKMQVAEHAAMLGIIDGDELARIFGGNLGGELGVQDNPARVRVRRQLDAYFEGREALGGRNPFERLPVDLEPALMTPQTQASESAGIQGKQGGVPPAPIGGVAMLRMKEIGRAMASVKFERIMERDPEWAQLLLDEYEQMRLAAGVKLIPELEQQMQQMAQQQAQAEQEAQQAEMAAKQQEVELEAQKGQLSLQQQQAEGSMSLQQQASETEVQAVRDALALQTQEKKAALDLRTQEAKSKLQIRAARTAASARPRRE